MYKDSNYFEYSTVRIYKKEFSFNEKAFYEKEPPKNKEFYSVYLHYVCFTHLFL